MKTVFITIAIILSACAAEPEEPRPIAPAVRLIAANGAQLPAYIEAAEAWSPLGFDFSYEDSGLVECFHHWYDQPGDDSKLCQITIGIVIDPTVVDRTGSDAASSRNDRAVYLHPSVIEGGGDHLMIAVAHEVGHIVLNTPEHTQGGIMGGATWTMRDVDRELACRAIHICIGGTSP